ncbi:hypothetical protein BCR34DRAFT_607589 [Clohesyomyces aquaticus]|uniref:Uncharacterized protein n=1 Tax=Clohesyomyces aquaticus TaxID=1231657 RepID=A0A1Y1YG57_9PLEO|nr:hypothetical protein BCR34DRAFT_607589 [Clohesyomyces aquaticus]
MTEADETKYATEDSHDRDQQPDLPRAGVVQGARASVIAKYAIDQRVQITEVIADKRCAKCLYVADRQINPGTGKWEYQLTETQGEPDLYNNGQWYKQKEVHTA